MPPRPRMGGAPVTMALLRHGRNRRTSVPASWNGAPQPVRTAKRLRKTAMQWPWLYRFVILALYTGSRRGVLFRLQWDQIDFASGVIHRKRPGEKEARNKRKTSVRVKPSVLRLLRLWKRQDKGLFPWVIHCQRRAVQKLNSFQCACKNAGLTDVSPHVLRHTRGTWLMQKGVDIWEAWTSWHECSRSRCRLWTSPSRLPVQSVGGMSSTGVKESD
jgi:integrase